MTYPDYPDWLTDPNDRERYNAGFVVFRSDGKGWAMSYITPVEVERRKDWH